MSSSTIFFPEIFNILRRIWRKMIKNLHRSSCKVALFFSDFNETSIFSSVYQKNTQISNIMKIRPLESELFQAERRTDGRTGMTKLIVAFRNFANTPKNSTQKSLVLESESLILLLTFSVYRHYSDLFPYSFRLQNCYCKVRNIS